MQGLYYRRGGVDRDGEKKTPFVLTPSGEKARFVAYCRKCQRGLCRDIEIGSVRRSDGKLHNVIAIEPCKCETQEDWDIYGQAFEEPDAEQHSADFED